MWLSYRLDPLELADHIAAQMDAHDIKPLSGYKLAESPLTPALWLTVKTAIIAEAAAVSLTLSLRQDVQLLRDEDIEVVKASKNSTGIMNPNNLKPAVLIKVDEFIGNCSKFFDQIFIFQPAKKPCIIGTWSFMPIDNFLLKLYYMHFQVFK